MSDWYSRVKEWNRSRGYVVADKPVPYSNTEESGMRILLVSEEYLEWLDASEDADDLDAICDLIFVLLGYAAMRGYPVNEAMEEVFRSNDTKGMERDVRGKLLKGPNYSPPNIVELLTHASSANPEAT